MEPEAKFPTAWSWILLIYAMESFGKDAAITHIDMSEFQAALKAFSELGISPNASPATIARTASKNSFSLSTPLSILGFKSEDGSARKMDEIFNFVSCVKNCISNVRSPNKHYIVIDGLDEILSSRSIQYKSLYALMQESVELNNLFSRNSVPLKIIILCRTDLFDKTPGPNKNKIRTPYAVDIDWYHDPSDPSASMLVRGANLRANISLNRDVDIFSEFLPSYTNKTPTRQYLLDMTRHTPRDFFQLLSSLQKFHRSGKMKEDEVKAGIREYSIKYFQPEIHDELGGYAEEDEINSFFSACAVVASREFSYEQLNNAWESVHGNDKESVLLSMCKVMFDCSAIGHVTNTGKTTHYSFKYRNRLSTFTKANRIMLHRGLWKALNIG